VLLLLHLSQARKKKVAVREVAVEDAEEVASVKIVSLAKRSRLLQSQKRHRQLQRQQQLHRQRPSVSQHLPRPLQLLRLHRTQQSQTTLALPACVSHATKRSISSSVP
jgi:hypothetical protein